MRLTIYDLLLPGLGLNLYKTKFHRNLNFKENEKYLEALVAQEQKLLNVNTTVMGSIPTRENEIFNNFISSLNRRTKVCLR